MKYPYIVKCNGQFYPSGVDVPEGVFSAEHKSESAKQEVRQAYTKTEINRMPIADLKALASEVDISGAEDMSGADIKKALIDYFGL